MISTFFDDVILECFDITCSLPIENKLWHHAILMRCMIRRQVDFEQEGFSNSCPSVETILQIFSLSPLLLCVFDVKSFEVFKQSKSSFRLQAHSPIEVTSKIWTSITPFSGVMKDLHCLFSLCTTCVQTISCFLWFTVVSPKENTYPLGSLLTNRNLLHPQKASRNDFHGPLG